MASFTTRPLYPWGRSFRYQLNRKLCGFQIRSGGFREQKVSGLLPGIEHWIVQTVTHFPYRQPHTGSSFIQYFSVIFRFILEIASNFYCLRLQWPLHIITTELICARHSNTELDSRASEFGSLFLARQPPVGQGLLIHEVSISHTTTHHSRYDSSGQVIRPLPNNTNTILTTEKSPCPWWDSKPHSQRASGCRPTP